MEKSPEPEVPPYIPLELFLTNLKLYRHYYSFYKSKGIISLEEALPFRDFPSKETRSEEKNRRFLLANIRAIRDELPKDRNQQIIYLLNKEIIFDEGITLTSDILIKSFKMGNKLPDICLPSKLQSSNIKASSLYSATVQQKKIFKLAIKEPFKNLKKLYLNDNFVQKIEKMPLPQLEFLELSNNFIRKIENLNALPNLKKLILSNNLIYILEGLEKNQQLEEIDLDNQFIPKFINFIIKPQCSAQNNSISIVNLENCNLISPIELVQFPLLQELNLKNNAIDDMMSVLSVCKGCNYIEKMNVLNNPFIIENKSTYKNFIIIACPKIIEIDGKEIKENEKIYVNNLFARKYGNASKKKSKAQQKEFTNDTLSITHMTPYNKYK